MRMIVSQWTSTMVVVLAVVSSTAAIKCFTCSDCGDSAGTLQECSSSSDVCMKIEAAGHTKKSCVNKAVCSLGTVEHGVVNAWNNFKNWISDFNQDIEISDEAVAKMIECCDDNYCNSSVSKLMNPLFLLLPLLTCLFWH
ncbi:uncharacterized protein LOC121853169 [Homarus americanus]|uniref:Uncharacterized protein n=1 Tax=Homarus americanus TaxID=6706 RepID=A0A8J5JJ71_HOMAM|nr:uncharacterized protein LOC121853169 [Homarus americanus]XP_042203068.1 uncharacterized protein LOC121853169 [Homarus americanus]KAG7156948.1 hypothetical protein Hamer_G015878 [Homarus americanus]